MLSFPHYSQYDAMDCGPTCLRIVAKYYGKHYKLDTLRDRSHITREGVSLLGISRAAESIGFRTMGVKIGFEQLQFNYFTRYSITKISYFAKKLKNL